ncbi:hydrolase 1, exosortase A system-associated [soil metagenome]
MPDQEIALCFPCHHEQLYGVLHLPLGAASRGILFIVGGPQYRIGSHRQFTLLARQFAADGVAVMRFDYRGMGDSEGLPRDFSQVEDDISAAIQCFFQRTPGMTEVVLWGLCDGASAAVFYANQDSRITGMVLVNPWVRTGQGAAKAYLKHYYVQRLLEPAFWKKIAGGNFNLPGAARSLVGQVVSVCSGPAAVAGSSDTLPEKMYRCLSQFRGQVLVILCSDDLTAQEFSDLAGSTPEWKKFMARARISRRDLTGANHTFSQRHWREQIGRWTLDWMKGK